LRTWFRHHGRTCAPARQAVRHNLAATLLVSLCSYKDDIEDARKGSIDAEEEVKDGNAVEHKIQED